MGLMGCNPTIRGFKGLGFGRVLPAPFGFEKGLGRTTSNSNGDGLTFYPSLPNPLPNEWSVQFWFYQKSANADDGLKTWLKLATSTNNQLLFIRGFGYHLAYIQGVNLPLSSPGADVKTLITINFNMATGAAQVFCNGLDSGSRGFTIETNAVGTLSFFGQRSSTGSDTGVSNGQVDEVRIYNKLQTFALHLLAYNSGIGENPPETEFLHAWYKCEQTETLDFSALQDGSDMRSGVRDYSGHNRHGTNNGLTYSTFGV